MTISPARWLRSFATLATLALGLLFFAEDAEACFKSEWSLDGLGAGQLLLPVASTVLGEIAAFAGTMPVDAAQPTSPGGTLVRLFSRPGLIGGFAAGFLGAGVLGVLFGHGVAGGLNGVASFLGLMFQLALLLMLARLIWTWWRGDKDAASANFSPRQLADAYGRPRHEKLPDMDASAGEHIGGEPIAGEGDDDVVNLRKRPLG